MILQLCGNHPSSTVITLKQQQNDKEGSQQQEPDVRGGVKDITWCSLSVNHS